MLCALRAVAGLEPQKASSETQGLIVGARESLNGGKIWHKRKVILVRHCPQGLFQPFFTFLLCHIFPPVQTFPRPHYLPLGLRGCTESRLSSLIIHSKYFSFFDWLKSHAQFITTGYCRPNLGGFCHIEPMTSKVQQSCRLLNR